MTDLPLRIGFVAEYYPPHAVGGAEWSTHYLARGLADRGHTVVVVTPSFDGGSGATETDRGLTVVRFPFGEIVRPGQKARAFRMENPFLARRRAREVAAAFRQHGIQIAHAANKYAVPWAALAARDLGIPWVVTFRDYFHHCPLSTCLAERDLYPDHCGWGRYARCLIDFEREAHAGRGMGYRLRYRVHGVMARLTQLWRLRFLRRADAIITVSQRVREIYDATGINDRITPIHNPLASDELPPAAETPEVPGLLFFAGKISRGKGADALYDAFAQLARERPEVTLLMAGEGPLRETIQARAREDGLASRVQLPGRLPHDEVAALYRRAAVTVVPSVWQEPFPRVILESYFAGTPVVASNRGGNPEIVDDGVTGFIVEPAGDRLKAAIAQVLDRPELRRNVIQRRQEYLRRFRSDVFQQHEALYRELIEPDE